THTLQAYMAWSQMPTWQSAEGTRGDIAPRAVMLRVFAVADGPQRWRVLPGGLARVSSGKAEVASMQLGGSSADVWAMTHGDVDQTTLLKTALTASALAQRKRMVTSRAAESLFWLGRYTERAENSVRLARLTLEGLNGEDQSSLPLLTWLGQMALRNTLVLPGVPAPNQTAQARRLFERALVADLGSDRGATSVGYNLRAVRLAGAAVRERLSQEHWSLMQRTEEHFLQSCALHTASADYSSMQALGTLKRASDHLAAITGLQTDRMTRDDGWRLLSIGRHIERLGFLAAALRSGLQTRAVLHGGGFETMVALFDSTITFHAQFQQSRDMAALIDLLVLDRDNPRSLAWVAHTLRGRLARLAGSAPDQLGLLSLGVPDPGLWQLETLCDNAPTPCFDALTALLTDCSEAAYHLSEEIGATYFTHSGDAGQSLGA
ncbi:MAG: alpha-E domain-containing protein, partial [Rhodoferax sp.]